MKNKVLELLNGVKIDFDQLSENKLDSAGLNALLSLKSTSGRVFRNKVLNFYKEYGSQFKQNLINTPISDDLTTVIREIYYPFFSRNGYEASMKKMNMCSSDDCEELLRATLLIREKLKIVLGSQNIVVLYDSKACDVVDLGITHVGDLSNTHKSTMKFTVTDGFFKFKSNSDLLFCVFINPKKIKKFLIQKLKEEKSTDSDGEHINYFSVIQKTNVFLYDALVRGFLAGIVRHYNLNYTVLQFYSLVEVLKIASSQGFAQKILLHTDNYRKNSVIVKNLQILLKDELKRRRLDYNINNSIESLDSNDPRIIPDLISLSKSNYRMSSSSPLMSYLALESNKNEISQILNSFGVNIQNIEFLTINSMEFAKDESNTMTKSSIIKSYLTLTHYIPLVLFSTYCLNDGSKYSKVKNMCRKVNSTLFSFSNLCKSNRELVPALSMVDVLDSLTSDINDFMSDRYRCNNSLFYTILRVADTDPNNTVLIDEEVKRYMDFEKTNQQTPVESVNDVQSETGNDKNDAYNQMINTEDEDMVVEY